MNVKSKFLNFYNILDFMNFVDFNTAGISLKSKEEGTYEVRDHECIAFLTCRNN